ncbi:MAG: hypothetical protein OHK0039_19220 [Bacteroidia bacterium]
MVIRPMFRITVSEIILCYLVLGQTLWAQELTTPPLSSIYPFLRHDLNLIDNNFRGLRHFYQQLWLLEMGRIERVRIVHIGDSHVQADWLSGRLRIDLQQEFGSAGRGLVFPYRVAGTNSPPDIYSASEATWQVRRNIQSSSTLPVGLCGITIQTLDPNFWLELSLKQMSGAPDYRFNKVTLFTEPGPQSFDLYLNNGERIPAVQRPQAPAQPTRDVWHEVQSGETLGIIAAKHRVSIEQLKTLNKLEGTRIYAGQRLVVSRSKVLTPAPTRPPDSAYFSTLHVSGQPASMYASNFYLKEPTQTLHIRAKQSHPGQRQSIFYGMVLENYQQPGILYHMIGVNGAKFADYNASEHFLDQLQVLQPDLIIISLGTNETVFTGFNVDAFLRQVDSFVHGLETYMPHADILITTPPDAYRARRYPNPQVRQARDVLLSYALNNDLACWNFYDIMGGETSIESWYGSGLAQGDRLHLTKSGYELAADLLYEALMNGYGSYRSAR